MESKVTGFEDGMKRVAQEMGVADVTKCIIMVFLSNEAKITHNLVCVVDVNQHENMLEALYVGF